MADARDRMPEAEVALKVAAWLVKRHAVKTCDVKIDGAHVLIAENEIFPIRQFLQRQRWEPFKEEHERWQGTYTCDDRELKISSKSGFDVVAGIGSRTIRVECKGGPLVPKKGKSERVILQSAIGQALTATDCENGDIIAVAVPDSKRFRKVRDEFTTNSTNNRFLKTEIKILLVAEDDEGSVNGLDPEPGRPL
jgi:hypothetical protein